MEEEDTRFEFETMDGETFCIMLNMLFQKNPEMALADIVFEDEDGIYHPIKKIVIDRKVALAMIALKESEELDIGDHEI